MKKLVLQNNCIMSDSPKIKVTHKRIGFLYNNPLTDENLYSQSEVIGVVHEDENGNRSLENIKFEHYHYDLFTKEERDAFVMQVCNYYDDLKVKINHPLWKDIKNA